MLHQLIQCLLKSHICYAAANDQILLILDIKNAFQNTFADNSFKVYVTTPYGYMNWIKEEEGIDFDKNVRYFRMMIIAAQGTKDAANQWNNLLSSIFRDYKLLPL